MDTIDTLISARMSSPAGIATGEVPVWNGSAWVRSSVTKVNYSGLNLTGNIVSGDLVAGTLVDANINAAAAIKGSKLATGTSGPPSAELDYVTRTTNFNITDTAEATGTAILTSNSVTFDGNPVILTFFSPLVATPSLAAGNVTILTLWEGATQLARLAHLTTPAAATLQMPVYAQFKFTPGAGTHAYKISGFATNTTGTPVVVAGAGGVGAYSPAFVRIVKA